MQEELLRVWRSQPTTMIFVTHSIDEAIILGSRVALMTRRPGQIKEVLDVDIPRPRDPEAVRRSPRYLEMREHIWHQLKVEVGGRALS
jgi:NitT/TauT family transport system ATP-binding protein